MNNNKQFIIYTINKYSIGFEFEIISIQAYHRMLRSQAFDKFALFRAIHQFRIILMTSAQI